MIIIYQVKFNIHCKISIIVSLSNITFHAAEAKLYGKEMSKKNVLFNKTDWNILRDFEEMFKA